MKTWRHGSHFVTIVLANKIDLLIKLANEKLCRGKLAINILCTVIGFISNLLRIFPSLLPLFVLLLQAVTSFLDKGWDNSSCLNTRSPSKTKIIR
jgi:hypothetical protein